MNQTKRRQTTSDNNPDRSISETRYSQEEIQRMLGQIDSVLSSCKAEKYGVGPGDMVKTVRGGKVVWITREQMNTILSKNRKLSRPKHTHPDGSNDDSLSSEMRRRVETCRALLDMTRKAAPNDAVKLAKKMRELEVVQNRSLSLAREVRTLDTAIQRKKAQDPVLRDIDQATSEMVAALENQDLAEVDLCQMHCDRYADEYLAKVKRLEPYANKVRECRTEFLKEKRTLYQLEFEFLTLAQETLFAQIPEILFRDKDGETSHKLSSLSEAIRSVVKEGRADAEALTDYPIEKLEGQTGALAEFDRKFLAPVFERAVEFVKVFMKAWSHFVEAASDLVPTGGPHRARESSSQRIPKRMTYQQHLESAN